MRPRHYDRFVLIGLCWRCGRSEFSPPPPPELTHVGIPPPRKTAFGMLVRRGANIQTFRMSHVPILNSSSVDVATYEAYRSSSARATRAPCPAGRPAFGKFWESLLHLGLRNDIIQATTGRGWWMCRKGPGDRCEWDWWRGIKVLMKTLPSGMR